MSDVVIIGGGFAGVWSAVAAAAVRHQYDADLTITVVAPGSDLVIRPRLYEAEPDAMRVPLDRILRPVGVEHVRAVATTIDPSRRSVSLAFDGHVSSLSYERLILATGSQLRPPDVPGREHIYDVDTIGAASKLDAHINGLAGGEPGEGRYTAVVVGAGFTGIEVATELLGRLRAVAGDRADKVQVVLVERASAVGPELGPEPRPVIAAALAELGIGVRLGTTVAAVDAAGVRLSDGSEFATQTVVWTAGLMASPLVRQIPGTYDRLGRLFTDRYLRAPHAPDVFAAGDTAAAPTPDGEVTLQSCQHAMPLGRYAGHNAAADLLGQSVLAFDPPPYVTCLDLGAAGALFTNGWQRSVRLTGEEAKRAKRRIVGETIYPPLDDAAAILRLGVPDLVAT